MPDKAQRDDLARFGQAVKTLFACRSIIRRLTTLDKTQQKELLSDIEASLQFLTDFPAADASSISDALLPPQSQEVESGALTIRENSNAYTHDERYTLDTLYRMYHAFMGDGTNNTISSFAARFGEVMALLSETPGAMAMAPGGGVYPYAHPPGTQEALERVRSFVADLYYMLLEFMRAVAGALQAHDIHVDTEELNPPPGRDAAPARECSGPDLRPLTGVYEMQQQFNERRGAFSSRVSSATVLLEFLEEQLAAGHDRSDELIAQINETRQLLHDLSCLLSGYENAALLLLRRT